LIQIKVVYGEIKSYGFGGGGSGIRTTENTMRLLMVAALLGGTLAGSSAFAQGSYVHHKWCLQTGSSQECAYDTLAECKASKTSPVNRCVHNTAPMNH
jgi:hypothetical protein